MRNVDIFNGDADGLCALHQWRLAHPLPPAETRRVTGVKRDINLLRDLKVSPGETARVFDISFESNRADALRLLAPNASGALTVSVRAPKARAEGADELCRRFATGGGRKAAAGINRLPPEAVEKFLTEFAEFFASRG